MAPPRRRCQQAARAAPGPAGAPLSRLGGTLPGRAERPGRRGSAAGRGPPPSPHPGRGAAPGRRGGSATPTFQRPSDAARSWPTLPRSAELPLPPARHPGASAPPESVRATGGQARRAISIPGGQRSAETVVAGRARGRSLGYSGFADRHQGTGRVGAAQYRRHPPGHRRAAPPETSSPAWNDRRSAPPGTASGSPLPVQVLREQQ